MHKITMVIDDSVEELPIMDALQKLTDSVIDDGKYCDQTIIDLRDALLDILNPEECIRRLMRDNNLTQKDLAKIVDCTQANISMILSGKRYLKSRMKEKLNQYLSSLNNKE